MSQLIPIFPLQIVIFPNEVVNLHIFEPRYKQLVLDIEKSGNSFGIPPFIQSKLMPIGTEVALQEIAHRYDDGRMDIRCRGLNPYQSSTEVKNIDDKLYDGSQITRMPNVLEGDPRKNDEIHSLISSLYAVLNVRKQPPDPSHDGLTFEIGHHIGLNVLDEWNLLRIPTETMRQDFVIDHLNSFIPSVEEQEMLRKRALMNGEFRRFNSLD